MPEDPRLSLREPVDVLAAIPFILGYHPADCVVVMGMRGKRLLFTARGDLPDRGAPPDEIGERVDHLVGVVHRQEPTGVLIVGFGDEDRVTSVVLALRDAHHRAGLAVLEAMRAKDGRYWSYLCSDPLCCPVEGSLYDPGSSVVAAEWTMAGLVALPDRKAYEDQIKPVDGPSRIAMSEATMRADERVFELIATAEDEKAAQDALADAGFAAVEDAIERQRSGGRLDDDEVAWLSALLDSITVRDFAWAKITGPPSELSIHYALWMDMMRRVQHDLIPASGCLFAFAAWRCGEGTLAMLALERVLAEDPTYSMAILLHRALAHGLPPWVLKNFPGRPAMRRPGRRPRRRSSSRRAGNRRG
jgi:hypothetical protein